MRPRVRDMCYQYFEISSSGAYSKISNAHSRLTFLHSSRVSLGKPACRRQYVRMALHPIKTKRTLLHYVKTSLRFSFPELYRSS